LRPPVALVVDTAERLTDRRTTDELELLLREADGHLRLIRCADADPLLPLDAYRRAGTLSEIRGGGLTFTPEETRQLLATLAAKVSPRQASTLQRETERWAVALRLTAAILQAGADAGELADALADDDGSPVQYLVAWMLDEQPPELRRLLLRLIALRVLHPDLVDQLAGPAGLGRRSPGRPAFWAFRLGSARAQVEGWRA
jgi:LuxR family maltose regulon positive regulatory protein